MYAIFIVNGENVSVELDEDEPLLIGRQRALTSSHNTGRPINEWEIRDERGVFLSPWDTPDSLMLPNYTRLFLSLKVGAGGCFRKAA